MSLQGVTYHVYTLMARGSDAGPTRDYIGGLINPTTGACAINILAGTHTGNIDLTVEVFDSAQALDIDSWEDIVELWLNIPQSEIGTSAEVGECTSVTLPHPGGYTVQVCANNRDAGDQVDTTRDPVEQHRIRLWPAQEHKHRVLKATSAFSGDFRSAQGNGSEPVAHVNPGEDDDPAYMAAQARLLAIAAEDENPDQTE